MSSDKQAPTAKSASGHDERVTKQVVTCKDGITKVEPPIETNKDFREPKGFT